MRTEAGRALRHPRRAVPIALLVALCALCGHLSSHARGAPAPSRPGAGLLQPSDFRYLGAFRLPGGSNGTDWTWSGSAAAYYPEGDPAGGDDGFPGSIFAVGHDHQKFVSEIAIPPPVLSRAKSVEELNEAKTLQPFHSVRGDLFSASRGYDQDMLRVGMAYMPPQGSQKAGKLYLCWGQHFQYEKVPSHTWCDLDLTAPHTAGPWYVGDYDNYAVNGYMFSMPRQWADEHTRGRSLATGRFREGGQGGMGPSLIAIAPWNDGAPPQPLAHLSCVPLLLYSSTYTEETYRLRGYHHSDEWTSGAWLTSGGRSAVIFAGTKGTGKCWYGLPDGTPWPDEGPWPEDPRGDRGWWSTGFTGQILLYAPSDFEETARGLKKPYEPQPYAVLSIDDTLYRVTSAQQKHHVGALCCDEGNGLIYLFEPLVDGDRPIVHVWRVARQ